MIKKKDNKMTIYELRQLTEMVKLKRICKHSGLKYPMMFYRVKRNVELGEDYSNKILGALKKFGLTWTSKNGNN